jgi:hypothetical protein
MSAPRTSVTIQLNEVLATECAALLATGLYGDDLAGVVLRCIEQVVASERLDGLLTSETTKDGGGTT